jgi:5'-nucleotidase
MKKYILLFILFFCFHQTYCQTKFNHILITNDDGIEDADRLLALAKSVKDVANRVSIIVSAFDRSGTSNYTIYGKYQSTFEVTCKYFDKENNISAYTLPANPADCVLLGLSGFFGDDRPDLVLSGINSGPNIGPDWFGSGTIGAARTSAFMGVKAIAFSGFDDDNKNSFTIIPDWIKEFISSGLIDEIGNNSYLTVGFPRLPFEEIKGAKLARRRVSYDKPELINLTKIYGQEPHVTENTTIWVVEGSENLNNKDIKHDDYYLQQGFIIITPMTIDENDNALMHKLREKTDLIPKFYK